MRRVRRSGCRRPALDGAAIERAAAAIRAAQRPLIIVGGGAQDAGQAVAALKCSMWGDIARVTPRDVEDLLSGGPSVRR